MPSYSQTAYPAASCGVSFKNKIPPKALQDRVHSAQACLEACDICPQRCGAIRLSEERGFCRCGRQARVASYAPHFGEEPPLVGRAGSGIIFFSVETLQLLEGIFDIYLPDAKYGSDEPAQKYSQAPHCTQFMKSAILEMHRQVGDLVLDGCGIAVRGLMVRHLVLPAGLAGTAEVIRFLSQEVLTNTYLNIMPQFRPEYNARSFSELDRNITETEFCDALRLAARAGLTRGLAIL